jgi:hypothetical protein
LEKAFWPPVFTGVTTGGKLIDLQFDLKLHHGLSNRIFRRNRFDQWQVLQEPPPQVAQPDEEEETTLPLLLKLAADMRRSTLFPLHVGQHTSLSFPKTRHSKSFLHFLHLNS